MRHLSAPEILTQPVGRPEPLPEEIVRAVLEHYDLGSLVEITPEPGGTANANVRVTTSQGEFYLRRRARHYATPAIIAHDQAYRTHLAAHGLPVAPPEAAREGQTTVQIGEEAFEITLEQTGDPPALEDLGNLAAMGEFLGRVHIAADGFQPPTDKGWGRYDSPAAAQALTEHLRTLHPTGEQAAALETLHRCSAALCESFPDAGYEQLPQQVIHGDYHPANLKCVGSEVTGLFDFDMASRQPRMLDVADGLLFGGLVRAEAFDGGTMAALTRGGTLDPARMQAFARGYQHHISLEPDVASEAE